jgi:thioredoxin 1
MKRIKLNLINLVFIASAFACLGQETDTTGVKENQKFNQDKSDTVKPIITFIELGSVNCIPCRQMQPVMKAIEEKYGEQVNIVFYDVWKQEQRKYAQIYGISLIPTQVFLDNEGKEIFRHEGFFPESEIDHFLQKHGLIPKQKS